MMFVGMAQVLIVRLWLDYWEVEWRGYVFIAVSYSDAGSFTESLDSVTIPHLFCVLIEVILYSTFKHRGKPPYSWCGL